MQIRNVLIVGGGTAGWMTAAALLKLCPHIKTSLIESPEHPVIGVGESTLGQINDFFAILGLEDHMWMKDTGSTYKTNIRFNDFYQKGETWDYPFGSAQERLEDCPHGWLSWFMLNLQKPEKFTRNSFARLHNLVGQLAHHNKLTDDPRFNFEQDTAYHMDAIKFGQWLKNNWCIPGGIEYHQGTIARCEKDSRGYITKLITDDDREFEYDLYIDCTGFKSLLLGGYMKQEFVSFHKDGGGCLLNDSAVTCHMPHEDKETEITNSTNCTAIENGWVWDVPLWERSGVGYVYSSGFATKGEAEHQLYDYLIRTRGKERADKASFNHVPFRNGKHEKSWVKNVCAIGLSNCFVEPLEATGLLVTHEQIVRLCNTLSGRQGFVPRVEVDMVNLVCDLEIEGFKNFIAAHYAFSNRETEYWQYVANEVEYDFSTGALDNLFMRYASEKHVIYDFAGDPQHNDGLRYIAAGMGFNPLNNHTLTLKRLQNGLDPVEDAEDMLEAERRFDEWDKEMYDWCMTLPSSYQFQKNTIYKE